MSVKIPTTQESVDQTIVKFEAALNQTIPANEKSFIRVLSVIIAMKEIPLYRLGAERSLQAFALTATGADLNNIGNNFGVVRKPAEAAVLTVSLPGTDPTIVPINTEFIGALNGVRYYSNAAVTTSGGSAIIILTAETLGSAGNLSPGDTLNISSQIPGMTTIAAVQSLDNTGADEETDEAYRPRVLQAQRSKGGGGNTADYKSWAEEVAGINRAFPYSGDPENISAPPPTRTVYIESETSIDPDGIAPQSLLNQARDSITTDPLTGIARQPLGLTDDTLIIRSITRQSFYFRITGLSVDPAIEAQTKTTIESALTDYARTIAPFIPGLDPEFERNDSLTDPAISAIVQDVVAASGGTIETVSFGDLPGVTLSRYTLQPGQLGKSGGVVYV